ncbi:hypothetical protein J0X14_04915 [Muricauda sp. CAU 1633]|uniref:hypothetical protein n=1 Tax=Allomuricauda sp. CAU 1633 TaxID=2816036 RepID=UPI001A8C8A37|nr:hypothetical protein [Muricauda sp. CAU 1633]MBO0321628.1 hypothetical protein [Muricauda sp. CAU 1633]
MRFYVVLFTVVLIASCKPKEKQNDSIEQHQELQISPLKKGEVSVLTQSMEFITADTLMSGWNTLIYENKSTEVHFLLMDLYPAGKTVADTKSDILPPFDEGMKLIMEGDMENAGAAFGKLPEWFQQVQFKGGTGLISPKHTAKSTVYLEPGTYIMECYVKMFNGEWHTSHGMLKEIIVTDDSTIHEPPTPTLSLDISSTDGIVLNDSVTSGKQIFKTNFLDQTVYEHFIGHDVNLVRYENNAPLDSLTQWLNWMHPRGLRSPAPEGFTFLGGMNNLPAGAHGFFEADLTPGNYVLISEVPEADKKNLMHIFTVK